MTDTQFVFQLADDEPDRDGQWIVLGGIHVAAIVPILFDHSRQKTIGRVVRVWREESRILGALEFAPTPSGRLCDWSTRHGYLTHVSPLFLTQSTGPAIECATIVEVTISNPQGEPKCIRNVLVEKPAEMLPCPSKREWFEGNLFQYDLEAMQAWLAARPVEAIGIPIDRRELQWDDPVLPTV